jgi:hypothetical protein
MKAIFTKKFKMIGRFIHNVHFRLSNVFFQRRVKAVKRKQDIPSLLDGMLESLHIFDAQLINV